MLPFKTVSYLFLQTKPNDIQNPLDGDDEDDAFFAFCRENKEKQNKDNGIRSVESEWPEFTSDKERKVVFITRSAILAREEANKNHDENLGKGQKYDSRVNSSFSKKSSPKPYQFTAKENFNVTFANNYGKEQSSSKVTKPLSLIYGTIQDSTKERLNKPSSNSYDTEKSISSGKYSKSQSVTEQNRDSKASSSKERTGASSVDKHEETFRDTFENSSNTSDERHLTNRKNRQHSMKESDKKPQKRLRDPFANSSKSLPTAEQIRDNEYHSTKKRIGLSSTDINEKQNSYVNSPISSTITEQNSDQKSTEESFGTVSDHKHEKEHSSSAPFSETEQFRDTKQRSTKNTVKIKPIYKYDANSRSTTDYSLSDTNQRSTSESNDIVPPTKHGMHTSPDSSEPLIDKRSLSEPSQKRETDSSIKTKSRKIENERLEDFSSISRDTPRYQVLDTESKRNVMPPFDQTSSAKQENKPTEQSRSFFKKTPTYHQTPNGGATPFTHPVPTTPGFESTVEPSFHKDTDEYKETENKDSADVDMELSNGESAQRTDVKEDTSITSKNSASSSSRGFSFFSSKATDSTHSSRPIPETPSLKEEDSEYGFKGQDSEEPHTSQSEKYESSSDDKKSYSFFQQDTSSPSSYYGESSSDQINTSGGTGIMSTLGSIFQQDGTLSQKTVQKDEDGNILGSVTAGVDSVASRLDSLVSSYKTAENDGEPRSQVMAPPHYADLGKKANDVFSKGYHFGVIKLDLKTKSESGVEFSSGIVSNQESGKVFGSLQSKYAVKDYGLTFTEKWNTDNTLATDITIQDKIAAGLKFTLEGTFAPQTGSKTGKLKTSFSNDVVAINSNCDLDMAGPIVDVAAVLHHQGWLAGVHGQFDSQKAKLSKNNFALGYQSKDFALHTNVDNGKDFGGSIYQKVSDKLECGVSMKWSAGSADTLFGVGGKFQLDADASLHAKINNKSLIGLGYQQKLRPGVVLTLSAAIDGHNFNAGGHKVGLALELEP